MPEAKPLDQALVAGGVALGLLTVVLILLD
jgi:hypothetical protein